MNIPRTRQTATSSWKLESSMPHQGPEWLTEGRLQYTLFDFAPSDSLTIVDLFCGCGGMTLGVREAALAHGRRFRIMAAVDMDAHASKVYRHNFGTDLEHEGSFFEDRLEAVLPEVVEHVQSALSEGESLDVLLAGPPCQGHSNLNNHTRGNDKRNELYLEVVSFAEQIRPKVIFIENVASAGRSAQNVVSRATETLERADYIVSSAVLDTSAYGVSQRRKRLVLVALRNDLEAATFESLGNILTPPRDAGHEPSLMEAIKDLQDQADPEGPLFDAPPRVTAKSVTRIRWLFDNDAYDLNEHRPQCHGAGHKYKSMYGRLYPDIPCQTITTGFGSMGQGRFVHPKKERLITPHEAARLQGFPDFFEFCPETLGSPTRKALQRMIGNAVPPGLSSGLVTQCFEAGLLNSSRVETQPSFESGSQTLEISSLTLPDDENT